MELLEGQASSALQVGLTIAAAIGRHSFAEGVAIGVSASTGEIALATVLIIGFALHNATEGFAIVGPLGSVRPTWGWLGLAGLIAGGPVFLGAMVGYQLNSEPLELAFYGLSPAAPSCTSSAKSGAPCDATDTANSACGYSQPAFSPASSPTSSSSMAAANRSPRSLIVPAATTPSRAGGCATAAATT